MTQPLVNGTLVTVGDIHLTQDWVVTPRGSVPAPEAQFIAQDCSVTTRVIPGWAVLFAILGFLFFLLGLLFLLVREERTTGFVQVQVVAPGWQYVTQIPVSNRAQVADLLARVTYANGVIASRRR